MSLQCPWHCDLCLGKQRHRRVRLAASQYWVGLGLNPLLSSACGRRRSCGEGQVMAHHAGEGLGEWGVGVEGQESLWGEWGELWGGRDKVGYCCFPYCWPLTHFIPAPRPQSCICEKGLLVQPHRGKAGRGEGIPVLLLVTRVTWLCFSGLQFVRWRLQYYLPDVVLVRTGLDTNTGKAHS